MEEGATDVRLLQWLEASGGLGALREQCSQYRTARKVSTYANIRHSRWAQPQAVYKLSMVVDPLDLLQYDGESLESSPYSR